MRGLLLCSWLATLTIAGCSSEDPAGRVSRDGGGPRDDSGARPIVEANPRAAQLQARQARQLLERDPQEAAQGLERAVALDPSNLELRMELARLYALRLGDSESALPHLEAVARQTDDAEGASPEAELGSEARVYLTRVALARNDLARADALLDEILETDPRNIEAWIRRSEVREARGELGAAREAIESGLRHSPGHDSLLFHLGRLSLAESDFEAARRHLEASLEKAPGNAAAHLALARCLRRAGEAEEAGRHAEIHRLLTLLDSTLHIDRNVGAESREETLEELVELMPRYGTPHMDLMKIYEASGRLEDAIAVMEKLAAEKPDAPLPHLQLARLHEKAGDEAAAQEARSRHQELKAARGKR